MTTDPTADRAQHVLDWIERSGATRFNTRDAFRAVPRSKFPKMSDLDPTLTVLEQHGYLRRLPTPPTLARGRPAAPQYEAHPALTA